MNRWEDVEILLMDQGWLKIQELCPVHQVGEGRLTKTSLRLRAEGGGHEGGEEPVPRHDEGAVLPQVPRTGQVQKQLCGPEFIATLPIRVCKQEAYLDSGSRYDNSFVGPGLDCTQY